MNPGAKWRCQNCMEWFSNEYPDFAVPTMQVKCCVFYGKKGRPPWKKPHNDGPLNGKNYYCQKCVP